MNYIIELEYEPMKGTFEENVNYYRCKQIPYWSLPEAMINKLTPYPEPDRKAIEDEVWSMVKDIALNMTPDDYRAYFGVNDAESIFKLCGCLETIDKYEAWKKQKYEIHVGDEVTFEMAFGNGLDNNMKAVALDQATTGEEWCVLTENGCIETHDEEDLYKTGRHFDEVAELLEKMREEEEC